MVKAVDIADEASATETFTNMVRYLSHFHPVYSCAEEISKRVIRVNYPAKTVLLRPGQVCNCIYFIEQGCLAASETREGKEYYNWVLSGRAIAQSARSFYNQTVCSEKIETLEPSVVLILNSEDLFYLIEKYHDFAVCMFKLMAHITVMREIKFALACIPNAESRVRRMAMLEPQLFDRVPLNVMAAYLSMTPETLSRITHKKEFLPLFAQRSNQDLKDK